MKLRGKIIIIVTVFVLAVASTIGLVAYTSQTRAIENMTEDNLVELAKSNSLAVSKQFEIFKQIAGVVGMNEQLYGDMLTNEQKSYLVSAMANQFGFSSGNILDINGVSLSDGTDFSDSDYVKRALAGEINVSTVSLSKLTNTYGCSIAAPLQKGLGGEIVGVVYFRLDIDFLLDITSQISISENSNAYIIDETGMVIVHEQQELINNISAQDIGDFGSSLSNIAEDRSGTVSYTFNDEDVKAGYSIIDNTNGWVLVVAAPASDFMGEIKSLSMNLIIVEIIAVLIGVIGAFTLATVIGNPIRNIKDVLVKISQGDFSVNVHKSRKKDEIGQLINATSSLQESITSLFGEANYILGQMADCDLTSADMKVYPGEFNSMSESVNGIKMILHDMIKNIQEVVANVGTGADLRPCGTEDPPPGVVGKTYREKRRVPSVAYLVGNLAAILVENIHGNSPLPEGIVHKGVFPYFITDLFD